MSPAQVVDRYERALKRQDYRAACREAVPRPYPYPRFVVVAGSAPTTRGVRATNKVRRIALHGCRQYLKLIAASGGAALLSGPYRIASVRAAGERSRVCVSFLGAATGSRQRAFLLRPEAGAWLIENAVPLGVCQP